MLALNTGDTDDAKYIIKIGFQVNGLTTQNEITNELRSRFSYLFGSDPNLQLLLSSINRITYVTIKFGPNLTHGILTLSCPDLSSAAKLAAMIERVGIVGTFTA